jgi:glutamyl-tRNA reductase
MALLLLGINHTTASIALREKVAFPPERVEQALAQLRELPVVNEAVIVSTCNRTELYLDCETADADSSKQAVLTWLADFHALAVDEVQASSYAFFDDQVVRHLMRVSSGLDSMVLGEPQILGQIKSAFAVSREFKAVGPALSRTFQDGFSVAKQVRTDTAIGQNPVSVAFAAVTLSERIFSDLSQLSVLLIGAGKNYRARCDAFARTRRAQTGGRQSHTGQCLGDRRQVWRARHTAFGNSRAAHRSGYGGVVNQ